MGSMSTGSIQELTEHECRELLGVGRFGRIAFLGREELELLPVNYAYDDGLVLIRTSAGSSLASIVDRTFVFEADHHDDTYQTGWSVTVRGPATIATDDQLGDFGTRLPNSWAGGADAVHIAIVAERVEGRRVRSYPA